MNYTGEVAAFGAAICWTIGAQCIEAGGKRAGATAVNFLRMLMALAALTVWSSIQGQGLGAGYDAAAWGWLALSGMAGLLVGDWCLFRSFVEIGPRVAMLIMTLSVPMAAMLGVLFLGESYGLMQCTGMAVTLGGVAWVIAERPTGGQEGPGRAAMVAGASTYGRMPRNITGRGVGLALCGAIGQAAGFTLAKYGMGDGDPFAATQIRFMAGALGATGALTAMGLWPRIGAAIRNRAAMGFILFAGVIGSALGVGLSLVAAQRTTLGVALTIMSLVPILLIPFAIGLHREHVSWRAAVGAVIAVAGVAMLVSS